MLRLKDQEEQDMATNRFRDDRTIYDYFPEVARANMSKAEARAEYARLRKIANRRLEALMRYFPESKTAKRYRKGFAALPREEKPGRIYKKLYEVARYLNEQQGSVSGQRSYRKKSIESLSRKGAPCKIANSNREHYWQHFVLFIHNIHSCINSHFCV